ncbi:MAG: hypothetical protein ABIG29_00995 [Candidatus Nealsonbacteria bacterium]
MAAEQEVVVIDLDGTITRHGFFNLNIPLPWWSWFFLSPFFLVVYVLASKPKKGIAEKMRAMKKRGCRFVILTRRPHQFFCFWITKRLLLFHRIPFDNLFCVGFGRGANERKLKIIKEIKAKAFVDSDKHMVEFMQKNSVNAVISLEYLDYN